jgi:hypothetical protein
MGQTVELYKTKKGFVLRNQETGELTVSYRDNEDSIHSATDLEAALRMIAD